MGNFNLNWIKKIYFDKFKRYFIIALILIGLFAIFQTSETTEQMPSNNIEFHFFFHPSCPHCKEQAPFNEELKSKFPEVSFIYHDITKSKESSLLFEFAQRYTTPRSELGVPATFFENVYFIGFDSKETTGKEIEKALQDYVSGKSAQLQRTKPKEKIILPLLGEISILDYSLPVLAVMLGLVDGFNPCAMWVLVYLVSLVVAIGDKKKIWIIVGSFVLASGMLYFLFMTAWLNAFLLMGYIRPLTIIIGLGALYFGATSLRDYFRKGAVCNVGDIGSREKTMGKIERIVKSPVTLATLFGIIALAFVVNSVEFACSSALPAVFTYALSISELSTLQYYLYILLYDFFFMLDDLVIFGLAAFAINTTLGTRYIKYCKLIGGIILVVLGLILAFAPHLLR